MTSDSYGTPGVVSDDSHLDHQHRKKRVGRACDSCRIKKTKCDGVKPCSRCVQDNKVCVFVEKKKQKDKSHPSGYVELLETRLELLSKSLEQLVALARPHLKFLDKLADDEGAISINETVNYLMRENGLMHNLPMEWEKGAKIAADLAIDNEDNVEEAAKSFADHKSKMPAEAPPSRQADSPESSVQRLERAPSDDTDLSLHREQGTDFSPVSGVSITDQLDFKEFSLGGYQSTNILIDNALVMPENITSTVKEVPVSDFDSDANSPYSSQGHIESPNSDIHDTPNYLFMYNKDPIDAIASDNQLTSLTKQMKSQGIDSRMGIDLSTPDRETTISQPQRIAVSRSKRGVGRPISPPQKLKNGDHVYKLGHHYNHHNTHHNIHHHSNHHHNRQHSVAKPLPTSRDNADDLHKRSLFNLDPSGNCNFSEFENLMDEFDIVDSFPSDTFKGSDFQGLDTYDTPV